jgi:hypothetical protein
MCYSAQIENQYSRYVRVVGLEKALNLADFIKKYWWEQQVPSLKIPKAIDAWFANPKTDDEAKIAAMIRQRDAEQVSKLEKDLFALKKRLADAERTLQTKETKKALNDRRVATNKIEWSLGRLNDIRRADLKPKDARMFPGWYAPVIVSENGQAYDQAHALPVPPSGQAEVLRHQVSRHVQRA